MKAPFYMDSYPDRDGWARMGEATEKPTPGQESRFLAMAKRLAEAKRGCQVDIPGYPRLAAGEGDAE